MRIPPYRLLERRHRVVGSTRKPALPQIAEAGIRLIDGDAAEGGDFGSRCRKQVLGSHAVMVADYRARVKPRLSRPQITGEDKEKARDYRRAFGLANEWLLDYLHVALHGHSLPVDDRQTKVVPTLELSV